MKALWIGAALLALLLAGCGGNANDNGVQQNRASAYPPPQPTGVDADEKPPSPPVIE